MWQECAISNVIIVKFEALQYRKGALGRLEELGKLGFIPYQLDTTYAIAMLQCGKQVA